MSRRLAMALAAALPAVALAVPVQLRVQGRALDPMGAPLSGPHPAEVRVWATGDTWATAPFAEGFPSLTLDDGYYALTLGAGATPLPHALLDDGAVYAIAFDGAEPLPAQALGTVPHAAWTTAVRASASAPVSCGAGDEGALYFDTTTRALRVCTGATGWQAVGGAMPGDSRDSPALSCRDVLAANPAAADGPYWLDPNGGSAADAFQAFCLMSVAPGGWTLISQGIPVNNSALSLCTTAAVGAMDLNASTVSAPAKMSNAVINQIWGRGTDKQLLVYGDEDNHTNGASPTWDQRCKVDFVAGYAFHTDASTNSLAHLDSTTVDCLDTPDWTITSVGTSSPHCGYYLNGPSRHVLYTGTTSYTGGACTANAGRSWPGSTGNYGCNTWKVFIR